MLAISKLTKYFLLVTALTAGFFIALITTRSNQTDITLQSVDELIKREIPIGASKKKVDEFLESRKIRYSGYNVGPDPLFGLPEDQRERKRYVTARIPQKPDPSASEYDIRIVFYFDEDYRLIDYKLQQLDNVP
jgi:hypothetical protein